MSEMESWNGLHVVISPSYGWPEDIKSTGLTHREVEVFALVMEGHNNREAAAILGIQHQSVKNHLHSLGKKLRVKNMGQAYLVLAFKGVVKVEAKFGDEAEAHAMSDHLIKGFKELLSDKNPTLDKKAKEAARKFMVEHGLYADQFKDRAKELKDDQGTQT